VRIYGMDNYKAIEIKNEPNKKVLVLKPDNLPLIIEYKDKRYVLILTKNDRLILQKTID
jgi:hypothetical protein